jgi:NAD(P)H dehydrogenase (quinone)
MAKILIVYHSRTGNTKKLARAVYDGVRETGVKCDLKSVTDFRLAGLPRYDAVILGSPTYYGQMAAEMKKFLDRSVRFHGRLAGKVGGAFTTAGGMHCGAETALLSMLGALMIHGMAVIGDASYFHYGPAAVGAPNREALQYGRQYGRRIARLTIKLFGK